MRNWLIASAAAQKDKYITANLPYADLMFAFGFATVGDAASARRLLADARAVFDLEPPPAVGRDDHEPAPVRVVRDYLFRAFEYRVEQAIAGKPHAGSLSAALLRRRAELTEHARSSGYFNLYLDAEYLIDRFRVLCRILEPQERVDPYISWIKNTDPLAGQLIELRTLREPEVLMARIRDLLVEGFAPADLAEVRFRVLNDALTLDEWFSESFGAELLSRVPEALRAGYGSGKGHVASPFRQAEMVEGAVLLGTKLRRGDLVSPLVGAFASLVRANRDEARYALTGRVAPGFFRCLRSLGLTDEIDRLVSVLENDVFGAVPIAELRQRRQSEPEKWAAILQAQLALATGWHYLGREGQAEAALAVAETDLLNPTTRVFPPQN